MYFVCVHFVYSLSPVLNPSRLFFFLYFYSSSFITLFSRIIVVVVLFSCLGTTGSPCGTDSFSLDMTSFCCVFFFSKLRFVLVSLALLPFVRYSIPHCVVHKCVLRRRLLIPAMYDVINYVRFLRPGRKQETPLKTIVRNNDK